MWPSYNKKGEKKEIVLGRESAQSCRTPKIDVQNNNMSVTHCFLIADFLLGISTEKRDWETADTLPARGRGEAQKSNGLHHLHDQCCCFQRSGRWATQSTDQRKNPTSWWGNLNKFCPLPGPSCISQQKHLLWVC